MTFAFFSRVPLETAYWDGTSASGNAAPYMRYATMGAAQLLKPPMIHRVEPLSAVEIIARIADASGLSIDRRAASAFLSGGVRLEEPGTHCSLGSSFFSLGGHHIAPHLKHPCSN